MKKTISTFLILLLTLAGCENVFAENITKAPAQIDLTNTLSNSEGSLAPLSGDIMLLAYASATSSSGTYSIYGRKYNKSTKAWLGLPYLIVASAGDATVYTIGTTVFMLYQRRTDSTNTHLYYRTSDLNATTWSSENALTLNPNAQASTWHIRPDAVTDTSVPGTYIFAAQVKYNATPNTQEVHIFKTTDSGVSGFADQGAVLTADVTDNLLGEPNLAHIPGTSKILMLLRENEREAGSPTTSHPYFSKSSNDGVAFSTPLVELTNFPDATSTKTLTMHYDAPTGRIIIVYLNRGLSDSGTVDNLYYSIAQDANEAYNTNMSSFPAVSILASTGFQSSQGGNPTVYRANDDFLVVWTKRKSTTDTDLWWSLISSPVPDVDTCPDGICSAEEDCFICQEDCGECTQPEVPDDGILCQ